MTLFYATSCFPAAACAVVTTYLPIDVQQRTLVRQVIVDVVIFVENVAMVAVASRTEYDYLFWTSLKIVGAAYFAAVVLKLVFYAW